VRKRTQLKTKAAEKFKGVRRERQWPSFLSSVSQSQLPCSLDFLFGNCSMTWNVSGTLRTMRTGVSQFAGSDGGARGVPIWISPVLGSVPIRAGLISGQTSAPREHAVANRRSETAPDRTSRGADDH